MEVLRAGRGGSGIVLILLFVHELTITHLVRVVSVERWRGTSGQRDED